MHNKYIITYECHDNAPRMWKVVQLEKYFYFSLYSRHFSLLSLTSLLSAPEREVTSPSDFKHICTFFVTFFSATIDGRDLIFGHKLHIGTPYRGKRFWTHQIPTSCLPTLLIFIHIEHTFCICPFLVAFFSATIDGRNLIFSHKFHIGTPYRGKSFFTRQIPTSCLPKSGGIISEH